MTKRVSLFALIATERIVLEGENCFTLTNTNFKYHECPFYKTNEEYKEGLRIYGGLRLK